MTTAATRTVAPPAVLDRDSEAGRLLSVGERRRWLGTSQGPKLRERPVPAAPEPTTGWGAAPVPLSFRGAQDLRLVPASHSGRPVTRVGDARGDLGGPFHQAYTEGRKALRGLWRVAPRVLIGSPAGMAAVGAVAEAVSQTARRRGHRVVWLRIVPDDPPTGLRRRWVNVIGWAEARDWPELDGSVAAPGTSWLVGRPGDPRPSLSLVARFADRGRELGAAVVIEVADGAEEMRRALATQRPDLVVMCCRRDSEEIRRTAATLEQARAASSPTGCWRAVVATVHNGDRWTTDARAALACLPEPAAQPVDLRLRHGRGGERIGRPAALDRILAAAATVANSNR